MVSLQRNKKDVEKVQKGDECGMMIEVDSKAQEGDILSLFEKMN